MSTTHWCNVQQGGPVSVIVSAFRRFALEQWRNGGLRHDLLLHAHCTHTCQSSNTHKKLHKEPLKHAAHKRMNCSVWHSTCAMPQRTILLQARSVDALPLGCRRSCPNLLHTCA
eukprot:1156069-Pelagomonas_calceolata.AAC.1